MLLLLLTVVDDVIAAVAVGASGVTLKAKVFPVQAVFVIVVVLTVLL